MPRRRDERPRVLGPYWSESKGYYRVTTIDPGATDPRDRKRDRYFDLEEEAQDYRDLKQAALDKLSAIMIEEAIELHDAHLKEKGTGEICRRETRRRMHVFFPNLRLAITRVTPELAKGYYTRFRGRTKKSGQPISVAYHRSALINARSLYSWLLDEGRVQANPFAGVKGIGKKHAGKEQHTDDEAGKLYRYCFARAKAGDATALGVLMAQTMLVRSSDLTRRIVRDADRNCTILRVYDGKTETSDVPREIPAVLQPLVRRLVKGRAAEEPLFPTPYTKSGHHTHKWLYEAMVRFCPAAGVPFVCPHSMKGAGGTMLARGGAAGDWLAGQLSHSDEETGKRHYVKRGSFEAANAARRLKVLEGGKR